MQLLMNILWATLGGGFLVSLQYLLGGIILSLTVIGIPFGMQCFKLAWLSLMPFGQEVTDDPTSASNGTLGILMNLLWLLFGGITTFLTHVTAALALAITVIGIPFAIQHLKLAVLALFPFGRRIVETR